MTRAAAYWRPLENGQVACDLCPISCRLRIGQTGPCATRANENGTMVPLHYGRIVSAGVDPIEKKPLYHFHPGRSILSVAAPGLNHLWSPLSGSGCATPNPLVTGPRSGWCLHIWRSGMKELLDQ